MLRTYSLASSDDALYKSNLQAIKDLLMKKHKFGLTEGDQASLEHVYTVFSFYGPELNYGSTYPPNRGGRNNGGGGNGMNNSQVASIQAAVNPYAANRINGYNDIFTITK